MKKLFLAFVVGCICQPLLGQNEVDALRYSWTSIGGTARYVGMGGAFGALGADFSTLSTNPAGIALYRRSEFTFTPGFANTVTISDYRGTESEDNKFVLNLNNLGLIANFEPDDPNWIKTNFGIGYNHQANFQQNIVVAAPNNESSMAEFFAQQAEGVHFEDIYDAFPFNAAGAWDTFLMDTLDGSHTSYVPLVFASDEKVQTNEIERRGSMGEIVMSFGGNFKDKLYVGMTMGIPRIRFDEESVYREDVMDQDSPVANFSYISNLQTRGGGINVKLGAIYRVSQWLRVGLAAHTPSWLFLTDSYSTEMRTNFVDGDNPAPYESPAGSYEYRLRTPSRYIASAAFILGKGGVISADYEYVDYSQAKLSAADRSGDDYSFSVENGTISQLYRSTHNIRVGAEWRILPPLKIRGGVMYQQSPFESGATESNPDAMLFSGGIGYRGTKSFIDLSFSHREVEQDYYMYDPGLVDVTENRKVQNQVLLTIGRFL